MADRAGSPTLDHVLPLEEDVERRRSLGIYYTPRSAAAMLARWAIRQPSDIILEPSFGGCTILEAALDRLRDLGCTTPAKQMQGFDVDPAAFSFLQQLLGRNPDGQFALQDFLAVEPGRFAVEAIIANPPFVSYHRMDAQQRYAVQSWRSRYAPPFSMSASLWAYFLIHSLAFLKVNGRIAFVLPSAAATSDYARPLMELLCRRFARVSTYRISERLFIQAGAEERTVMLLADGYRPSGSVASERLDYSITNLAALDRQIAVDRCPEDSSCASVASNERNLPVTSIIDGKIARGDLCSLKAVTAVQIGEVVGDVDYFVKARDEWEALQIPERHLRPIVTRTKQLNGLQVKKKDVTNLYGAIPLLLAPPKSRIPQSISRYLRKYPTSRRNQNTTFSKRDPWYGVSYDPTASAFIGSLSHESPRIVQNVSGISCANGLYKLKVQAGLPTRIHLSLASLTTTFQLSAELVARIKGSGALKLEPSDVSTLLIPALDFLKFTAANRTLMNRLDDLVRRKEIAAASREADDSLLIKSGILSNQELTLLRNRLLELRGERLASRKGD